MTPSVGPAICSADKPALSACQLAVSRVGLQGLEVDAALEILRGGGDGAALQQRFEEDLSTVFDDEYFRLGEAGDNASKIESLRPFQKARAAAALAFALSSDSDQLQDAIYEAIISSNNQDEIVQLVGRALAGK